RRGQRDRRSLRRDIGQQRGVRTADERLVVVLADGVDVHSDFFGVDGDSGERLNALVLSGGVTGVGVGGHGADAENAYLHDELLSEATPIAANVSWRPTLGRGSGTPRPHSSVSPGS